ncbi:HTH domain-containing protein, partial [Paenibacillus taihuensis]
MSNRRHFSQNEIQLLEKNPYVHHVTEKSITYAPSFKVEAVRAYHAGQTPMEIFLRAGFPIEIIGQETPKRCLKRWRSI